MLSIPVNAGWFYQLYAYLAYFSPIPVTNSFALALAPCSYPWSVATDAAEASAAEIL